MRWGAGLARPRTVALASGAARPGGAPPLLPRQPASASQLRLGGHARVVPLRFKLKALRDGGLRLPVSAACDSDAGGSGEDGTGTQTVPVCRFPARRSRQPW
jgi:hypothetical protein